MRIRNTGYILNDEWRLKCYFQGLSAGQHSGGQGCRAEQPRGSEGELRETARVD
jgi:hypothetical protein